MSLPSTVHFANGSVITFTDARKLYPSPAPEQETAEERDERLAREARAELERLMGTRREFSHRNLQQVPLYRACRRFIAQLATGARL